MVHDRLRAAFVAAALSAFAATLPGCDSHDHDDHSHSTGTLMTMRSGTSDAKLYQLKWETDPATVVVGELFRVRTTLQDANGQPVLGATLAVDAWMPEHGHGMEGVAPLTTESTATQGLYETEGMRCQMPGQWELRFTIDGTPGADKGTLPMAVQ